METIFGRFCLLEVCRSTSNLFFKVGRYMTLIWIFEFRRHMSLIWFLRWEDTSLIWTIPSPGKLYKPMEEIIFYPLPCQQVHSSIGIWVYFRIPAYSEDQLRHPILWTEQKLSCWTFCSQPVIVDLPRPQFVSNSSNPSFYI